MKSLEELKAIRDKMQGSVEVRNENDKTTRIVVGMATCGIAAGARPVLNTIAELVDKKGLTNVTVTQTGCIGMCMYEPIVEVYAPGADKVTYVKVDPEKAAEIVERHIVGGTVVEKYTIK